MEAFKSMKVDWREKCFEIARKTLLDAADASEPLRSSFHVQPIPELDLSLDFDVQPGLGFPVSANLQNADELQLAVGEVFCCNWFPCNDPRVASEFREAILGILSGEYRVVEFCRNDKPIRAELQRPTGGTWTKVATYSKLRLPSLIRMKTRILRNESGRSLCPPPD